MIVNKPQFTEEDSEDRTLLGAFSQNPRSDKRTRTTRSEKLDVILGMLGIAGIMMIGAGLISTIKRQDNELQLVNPQDGYVITGKETEQREPQTTAYFVPETKDIERDDIMDEVRQDAAKKVERKASEGYKWDRQEARRQWRLSIGLTAENPKPVERISKFSIEGYLIDINDTLSQISEKYQTRYGLERTMSEIIDLNNAILTGKGLDNLAQRYGVSAERMREQADKIPRGYMRLIDDKDMIWGGYVLPIPYIPKE